MASQTEVAACYSNPPWYWRLWRFLGYRWARADNDAALQFDQQPERWLTTDVYVHLSWLDRSRLLVAGNMMVQVKTRCEHAPGNATSISAVGILPPREGRF